MKKFIVGAALIIGIGESVNAQPVFPTVEVESFYRLKVDMGIRDGEVILNTANIYEFVPKGAPNMLCVYVDGSKAGSLSCFPKSNNKSLTED